MADGYVVAVGSADEPTVTANVQGEAGDGALLTEGREATFGDVCERLDKIIELLEMVIGG